MKYFSVLLLVLLMTIIGCSGHQDSKIAANESDSRVPAPSTFTGRIPGTDCDHIDVTLNFRPDGLYQLRQVKFRGEARDILAEMGHWKYDPTENLIVLGRKRGSLKTLTLLNSHTLRLLDIEGKKISSKINYDLHEADTFDSFNDTVRMRGMYSYAADAGTFIDCQNGVRFLVADAKDNARLEQIYNNTPHGQGESLLVSIEGSLQLLPKVKGSGHQEMLVVERFLKINPEQDCTGANRKNKLFNTTWRVVELDGKPVTLPEGQREAYVILEVEGNRMHGFSGCNKFFGTYLIKGEIFVFNKMAGTRMACLKGLDMENEFLRAMHDTEAYRIVDGVLELRDRDENILARLRVEK